VCTEKLIRTLAASPFFDNYNGQFTIIAATPKIILMMKPAQERKAKNVTDGLNGARYGRVLI
jgi:hypothetical protein